MFPRGGGEIKQHKHDLRISQVDTSSGKEHIPADPRLSRCGSPIIISDNQIPLKSVEGRRQVQKLITNRGVKTHKATKQKKPSLAQQALNIKGPSLNKDKKEPQFRKHMSGVLETHKVIITRERGINKPTQKNNY